MRNHLYVAGEQSCSLIPQHSSEADMYKDKKMTSLRGSCPLEVCSRFGRPLDTNTKTLHLLGTPRHAPELTRASETEAGGNRSVFSRYGVPLVVQYHLHARGIWSQGARFSERRATLCPSRGNPCSHQRNRASSLEP